MKRPRISINFAISADGKITSKNGDPSGWTSDADTERYFAIRRQADAIMVGRGTQEADNMTLTTDGQSPPAARIVVSRTGNFDPASKVFKTAGGPIFLIVTDVTADVSRLQNLDAEVIQLPLADALTTLSDHGIQHLLCEGGGQLVRGLAELDAIDTIHLTWAGHTVIGGAAPTITGLPADFLPSSRQFDLSHFEPSVAAQECFLTYTRLP